MKIIGNILWLLLTGLWGAICYALVGVILCITIIGIPFGKQFFKLAGFILWPMGKEVDTDFESHLIANIVWLVLGGFSQALGFIFAGILWCITIIGIPLGKQCFKLAKLSIMPFGAYIY